MAALGKGLGSLIPSKESSSKPSPVVEEALAVAGSIVELDPSNIHVNPHQPRKNFNPSELEDLMNSIKIHGIIQPLVVTQREDGSYELIAGERRLRSAKTLGLKKVPALIRNAHEQEKLELALIENIQRKQLNPLEEAISYRRLLDEFNITQEEVAIRVGKSRSVISNMVRLLDLPMEVQQAIMDEKITEGHARAIAALESPSAQLQLLKKIIENKISVRDTEEQVRTLKGTPKKAFDPIIAEYEDVLRKALGTKVTITKKGSSGEIKISFSSMDDFKDIIRKLQ